MNTSAATRLVAGRELKVKLRDKTFVFATTRTLSPASRSFGASDSSATATLDGPPPSIAGSTVAPTANSRKNSVLDVDVDVDVDAAVVAGPRCWP
jgi:ABC-2 type transport system permease protein